MIVGNTKIAEEVVQEGMLKVWTGAGTFRVEEEGANTCVKSWIMKIIARESYLALRRRKRSNREIASEVDVAGTQAIAAPVDDSLTSKELIEALQGGLRKLEETDRQLIALHFGGGLNQIEISKALSISQQTVSYRLGRILKELRADLSAAGFAAVAPLGAELVEEALSSTHVPGTSLYKRVQARIQARPSYRPVKGAAAKSSALALSTAGVVCIGAICTGAWLYLSKQPPPPPPAPTPTPAVAANPSAVTASEEKPRSYRWNFDKGPPLENEFGFLNDKPQWKWVPEKKAMVSDSNAFVALVRPELPNLPMILTATINVGMKGLTVGYGATLHRNSQMPKMRRQWRHRNTKLTHAVVWKTYFVDRRMVEFLDDVPARVIEFDEDLTGAQIILSVDNVSIGEIALEPVDRLKAETAIGNFNELTKGLVRVDQLSAEEIRKLERE
jgi:RNA polymerase sigma factor (sigma-70 family)